MPPASYELYRRSAVGRTLIDSLDELIQSGLIDPQLAMKILSQFDASVAEALAQKVKAKSSFKGHLNVYRFCDDVWTFMIQDANFKMENETVRADKVKIIACAAKS
jgi:transcription initiation factor TFIIA small subunit